MAFDIEAARIAYRQRISARRDARERRRLQAQLEAEKVIEYIKERYSPRRIIQWGSILRPEHFTESSDIDIAVEGIADLEEWSRMERDVERMVTLPLDLVPFDRIHPEHQKQILLRGTVVYERPDPA